MNSRMRSTVFHALLGIVMLSGLALRTWRVIFDGGLNDYPDERSTTCNYAPTIGLPSSLDEFSIPGAARSTLFGTLKTPDGARLHTAISPSIWAYLPAKY